MRLGYDGDFVVLLRVYSMYYDDLMSAMHEKNAETVYFYQAQGHLYQ